MACHAATPSDAKQNHAIPCQAMPSHAKQCQARPSDAKANHAKTFHTMPHIQTLTQMFKSFYTHV